MNVKDWSVPNRTCHRNLRMGACCYYGAFKKDTSNLLEFKREVLSAGLKESLPEVGWCSLGGSMNN